MTRSGRLGPGRSALLVRTLALLLALVLVLGGTLTACGGDGPQAGAVDPVDLAITGPSYAVTTADGLLLRAGASEQVLPRSTHAEWLPGDRALLLGPGWRAARLWDAGSGSVGGNLGIGDPNRSVTQLNALHDNRSLGEPERLTAYDLDGEELWEVDLPLTDNPDADDSNELERSYLSAHTIDGATFLRWSDGSEWYEDGDYGLLRVGPGGEDLDEVLVNVPVIAVWLAADGSALLATKRVSGDPCGGCQVTQELIEIDPGSGEVLAEHPMPEAYDEHWDVREVDKVGDKIAVRFEETLFGEPDAGGDWSQRLVQRGTWVLDDEGWSMVPDSDRQVSWWQGPDERVVATPQERGPNGTAGYRVQLTWEHDGEVEPLTDPAARPLAPVDWSELSVPGQLLPPG